MPSIESTVENQDKLLVVRFYIEAVINEGETKKQGRPIYDDREFCEIRSAGNRQTVWVFPAHEVWKVQPNDLTGIPDQITYAMRFNEQYKKFKAGLAQTMSGTPLEEAPFLTQAKRLELKALNVHTLEQLAAIDGQPLKQLGMGGREWKNQAIAYLENAAGTADVTKLAADVAGLRDTLSEKDREIAELREALQAKAQPRKADAASPFGDWDDADLKNWLAEQTGSKPKGNPSHATLVQMADEVNAELAAKAKAA